MTVIQRTDPMCVLSFGALTATSGNTSTRSKFLGLYDTQMEMMSLPPLSLSLLSPSPTPYTLGTLYSAIHDRPVNEKATQPIVSFCPHQPASELKTKSLFLV